MADLVEIVRRDTRLYFGGDDIQNLSPQPTDFAHGFLPLGVEQVKLVPVDEAFALRDAGLGIVGTNDGLGQFALRGQGVDGPQGTSKGEGGKGIVKTGCWIRFRYDLGGNDVVKNTILSLALGILMHGLVLIL